MPAIFRYKGYRFFFYSNEGYPREPLHVHVRKADAIAKIWLEPELSVASSYGMTSAELKELCQVAEDNKKLIQEYWNEHFGF